MATEPEPTPDMAPTIAELRDLLNDLHYEINNVGAKTQMGLLFTRAHQTMVWLLHEYLDVTG